MSEIEFSQQEIDNRRKKVRGLLEKWNLDAIVVMSIGNATFFEGDVKYFVGPYYKNKSVDDYVVFPREGEPKYILAYYFPSYFAKKYGWIKDVRYQKDFRVHHNAGTASLVVEAVKEVELKFKRIGISGMMSSHVYNALKENFPQVEIVDASDLMREAKKVKSSEEIKQIERSGALADEAWEEVKKAVKPGVKNYELVAILDYVMRRGGAEKVYNLIKVHPISTALLRWPVVPQTLKQGDAMGWELSPCYGGYWTQLNRNCALGRPKPEFVQLYELTEEAHRKGVAKMRPGNTIADVTIAIEDLLTEAGYPPQIRVGHAQTGLDLMERALSPTDKTVLEPGMELIVHPNAVIKAGIDRFDPDALSVVGPGDTYVVAEGEPRKMTKSSWDLVVF